MAHLHIHTLPDGTETSPPVIDPADESLHWHTVSGVRTSSNGPLGGDHTHALNGQTTSPPIDRDTNKGRPMNIEHATLSFKVAEVKELHDGDSNIGVFSGHLAAFARDRMDDVFLPGAFKESLARHRDQDRPIRMLSQHDTDFLIGGFPIDLAREDDKGLFVVGNINLDVQRGRESFSLMKQGVLTDMSIGFSVNGDNGQEIRDGIRFLKDVTIWEGSLVTEPANVAARITEIKAVVPFQDLPLAARDRPWDSTAAIARIREFTDSTEEPSSRYRRAFLWYDRENADNFGAYKLPIATVIDGRLTAVPRGIFAAAAALLGARGGVDIPDADRPGVIRNVERYYAKMGLDSPFSDDEKQYFVADDVKAWTERDVEKFLRDTGMMSKSAAKTLADRLDVEKKQDNNEDLESIRELMAELKGFKKDLTN